jgi:hypothetical protein
MFAPLAANNVMNQLTSCENIQDKLKTMIDEIMKKKILYNKLNMLLKQEEKEIVGRRKKYKN